MDRETSRIARRVDAARARVGEDVASALAETGPITGRASSDDGAVTVTVGPGGAVQDVRLTDRAMRRGTALLAREVVVLADRATAQATRRLRQVLDEALPPTYRTQALPPRAAAEGTDPAGDDRS